MSTYAIINGAFVAEEEAKILVSDLAVQRGYGIFDYFRTTQYRPGFLDDHLDRFYHSAAFMHLPVEEDRSRLKALIAGLIEKNNLPNAGIRLTLTGGYSGNGYTPARPNLLITQSPFIFDAGAFHQGLRLITHDYQRQLPEVKTIDYLQAIYLQPQLKARGADDVLYHQQGALRECPRANFFLVTRQGEILTPAHHILKGITRKKILAYTDLPVREADLRLEDLENAAEAFISSTTKEAMPVLQIDGKPVGDGKPGAITTEIFSRLLTARQHG